MAFGSGGFVTIVAIWGTLQSRLRRTESAPLTLLSLKFILATILCLCLVHTQHISYNTGFAAASISILHPSHVARCLALWSYCSVIILHCDHTALWSYCTVIILHCDHTALWSYSTVIILHCDHTALWSYCTVIILHYPFLVHFMRITCLDIE